MNLHLLKSSFFLVIGAAFTATAISAPRAPSIEVTVTGQGSVTSDPAAIDCKEDSGICTSQFSRGDVVTLTATPETNANFVAWGGSCEGSEPVCTVNLKAGTKTVSAVFEAIEISYPAPVQATGQVSCWDTAGFVISCEGTGQDGDLQAGVNSINPRFTNNGDGTVTGNLTGLVWLKNANCMKTNYPEISESGGVTWQMALDFVSGMNNGTYSCGVSQNDWRLPNIRELESLLDYEQSVHEGPLLPDDHLFENLNSQYWSSTTHVQDSGGNYALRLQNFQHVYWLQKASIGGAVLPVRGGQ
jgi:hypothetical protein